MFSFREEEKFKRDDARNALESFIHDVRDKLEQDEYSSASTDDEKTAVQAELTSSSEWLEYESSNADAETFQSHLTKLKSLTKDIWERVRQVRERPEVVSAMNTMLNISEMFHANAVKAPEEIQIFSEVELNSLRKLIDDTKKWMKEAEEEDGNLPRNVMPSKFTLSNIADKIAILDREVKYLLNKAKLTPPKVKKPVKEESANKVSSPLFVLFLFFYFHFFNRLKINLIPRLQRKRLMNKLFVQKTKIKKKLLQRLLLRNQAKLNTLMVVLTRPKRNCDRFAIYFLFMICSEFVKNISRPNIFLFWFPSMF